MEEPVYSFRTNDLSLSIFSGRKKDINPRPLAKVLGAPERSIWLVAAASNEVSPGFRCIHTEPSSRSKLLEDVTPDMYGDAIHLHHRGSAAIMRTGGCPIAVLQSTSGYWMTHLGRPALTPRGTTDSGQINNLLSDVFNLATAKGNTLTAIYITGAVSGKYFEHDQKPSDVELIRPFAEFFGEAVFHYPAKGAIDLVSVIREQLTRLGVDSSIVHHDGLCTKEEPRLANYRDDPSLRNPVILYIP